MAYVQREKLTVINSAKVREELLDILIAIPEMKGNYARKMVFYPTPMSAIRWSRYLTPTEIDKYLCPVGQEDELGKIYDNNINSFDIADEDMGL